jgi:integrase
MKKAKRFTFKAGDHGQCVVVYERKAGGLLYARAWDRAAAGGRGGWRRVSLKHRDQERATTYALEQAAKLRDGSADITAGKVTLAHVLALYQQKRTPSKSLSEQQGDERRAEMWARILGGSTDPLDITLEQWETFIAARRTGAIDAYGNPVAADGRKPVRARSVQEDCLWLRWVFNWATNWKRDGRFLLTVNPVKGFEVQGEKNPRRPVATDDRYDQILPVAAKVHPFLVTLLILAHGTGRRLSPVLGLRYQDLRLAKIKTAPHGAIQWPGETDKEGQAWSAPISADVRGALDRVLAQRPGVGAAYLFPSPRDAGKPVRKELASAWLERAEVLAKVPKMNGSLWHAYRRGWATARKHWPDADVAAAGGWKNAETLRRCYQQADEASVLRVVTEPAELREIA